MKKYKTLEEFFADQVPDMRDQIKMIRKLLFEVEPTLVETLKWNAPNYVYNSEDRITVNVMNLQNKVKLVLHMGATKKENKKGKPILVSDEGIVGWNSDIRGTITFENSQDIESKQEALKQVVRKWLLIDC